MKLNEKYNPESFVNFIQDFLPEDFILKEEDIVINKDRYKEITKARILGFCGSLDLHVLEMDHTRNKDPRVAIATDAFKILADHWIHRALVIFNNNDSDNYRFSYLTITLDLNDKNNKTVKKYSNARRYSFYLGSDAKVKTPEKQLKGRIKDVGDLLNRFSVEVVNKQFYLEVAKFFDELVSIEDQNLILPGISETDINTRKSFAVRLIGRAMFCWFLKQKKSDNGQLVPDEILSSKVVSDNYYHNVLEPLFFGVLNTSIDARDIRTELFDKVPYLNGGLFNPQTDDYYELDRGTFASKYINTLKISDKWFKEFFELLETYNFTIDENTVFDQELSVDPEMLGRIFENLLAEINPETGSSERKRTGSFYTPRQIVEYMVDQSLIEYFKTKTNIEDKKLTALASYDLADDTDYPLDQEEKEQIIDAVESLKILEPACGSGAYPIGALQKIVYILQQVDPDCTMWLNKKLQGVPDLYKQKIINEVKQNPFDYTRKLDVIKNSIFGVDIQPIAVDVSRLRCFLTLVVESEIDDNKPNRGIEPLPNLDFKFVCANSLISAPEQDTIQDPSLFGDVFQEKLASAVDRYFSSSGENKRSANNEIHKLIDSKVEEKITHLTGLVSYNGDKKIEEILAKMNKKQIDQHSRVLLLWASYKNIFENKPVDFFGIKYFFPSIKEGFDIVIGNPPYVGEKGNKDIFRNIKDSPLGKRFHLGKMDLFYFFFHLGVDMLKDGGVLSFITTNYYITATGAKKLIEDFKKRITLLKLVNFGEMKIFESALGQHNMITILQKGKHDRSAKTAITKRVGYLKNNNEIIQDILNAKDLETNYFNVEQDKLYNNNAIVLSRSETSEMDMILDRVQNKFLNLKDRVQINQGLKSNADYVMDKHINRYKNNNYKKGSGIFILSKDEIRDLNLNADERGFVKPLYKNSDIDKYTSKMDAESFVLYITKKNYVDKNKHPSLWVHLNKFVDILKDRAEVEPNGLVPLYALTRPRSQEMYESPKILAPYKTSKGNCFGYTEDSWYASGDVYFITKSSDLNLKVLLGILNSKLIYIWLSKRGKRKGNIFELYTEPIQNIPVPKIDNLNQTISDKLFLAVNKIIEIKKSDSITDTIELEDEIDELVMDLYELSEEEKNFVENY